MSGIETHKYPHFSESSITRTLLTHAGLFFCHGIHYNNKNTKLSSGKPETEIIMIGVEGNIHSDLRQVNKCGSVNDF
jgi:hypothetical protein